MPDINDITSIGGKVTLNLQDFINAAAGTANQPTPSLNDMFNAQARKSPGAQAIPYTSFYTGDRFAASMPYTNPEEMRAQQQSSWDKWGNGITKMLGTASSTFVGGTLGTLVGAAEYAATGKFSKLYDNEIYRGLDNFNKYMEDALPNFYKQEEMDADWYSPKNILTANFWSDKVVKNLGFSLGAIGAGYTWGAALNKIGITNRLVQAGKGMEAVEAVEGAIVNLPRNRRFGAISEALDNLSNQYLTAPLKYGLKNSDRIVNAFMGTMGEASLESLGNLNDTRNKLINDFFEKNGYYPTGTDMDEINATAERVGNWTWGLNVALLTGTNYLQFPKILSSSRWAERNLMNAVERESGKPLSKFVAAPSVLERVGGEGGRFLDRYLVKPTSLLVSPIEGFEEGAQFAIQTGVADYFSRAYKNKQDIDTYFNSMWDMFKSVGLNVIDEGGHNVFNTKEGMENVLIGAVSGGLQTSFSPFGESKVKERGFTGSGGFRGANTETALAALNTNTATKALQDGVKYAGIAINSQKLRQEAVTANDILSEKDYEKDYELAYILPRVKYGKMESIRQDINYYRNQAVSDKGFEELKNAQLVHPEESKEKFLARLNSLEDTALKVNDNFKMLFDKYGNIVTDKGERIYTDSVIEKMSYALGKIGDYDKRVAELGNKLGADGVPIDTLKNAIVSAPSFKKRFALKELMEDEFVVKAKDELIESIDAIDATDDVKNTYKSDIADYTEMILRRKMFIDEYNKIRDTPSKFNSEPKVDQTPKTATEVDKTAETEEAKDVVKIETDKKEIQYNVGGTYFLGSPFEEDAKGKTKYRGSTIKLIAINEDGSVQAEDEDGKIKTLKKEDLLNYKLGDIESLDSNPTANFFYTFSKKTFEFNFGKKGGGFKTGRLVYDPEEDKLFFEYKKSKKAKEYTYKELNRGFFIAKDGYNNPRIKETGKLSQEEQAIKDEYVNEQAWKDEQDMLARSEEHRLRALFDLYYDTEALLDQVNEDLLNKALELELINDDIKAQKKIIKAEEKAKVKFSETFNKASKALIKLGKIREEAQRAIEDLEEQKDELEFNLTYIQEFAENLDALPVGFEDFKKEYDKQVQWVEDMLSLTEKADVALKGLAKGTDDAIKDVIMFMKDIFDKFDKNYPSYISDAFESIVKSASSIQNINAVKEYLTDFTLTQDLSKPVTLNEKELNRMTKAMENVVAKAKELETEIKAMYEIQDKLKSQARKFRQAKRDEMLMLKDKDLQDLFFKYQKSIQNKNSGESAGPMTEAQEEEANKSISTAKRPIQIAYSGTIVSSSSKRASDLRHDRFMDGIDFIDKADRANLRRIYVTKYNEKSLNLEGIIEKHSTEVDSKGRVISVFQPKNEDEELILAVYVYKDPETGEMFYINELGEKTEYQVADPAKFPDEPRTDLDEIIWAAMPAGSPTTREYGYRYDVDKVPAAQAKEALDKWLVERAKILSYVDETLPEESFLVSNGVVKTAPNKKGVKDEGKKRKIVGTLISREQLDSQTPYIVVNTTGVIVHQNRQVRMPKGRVAIQNGGTLRIVNTGNLTNEQVDTTFAVLKEFVGKANVERTFDNNYSKYLQGVLNFESPYKKKEDEIVKNENIGRNQFYFHKGRLYFGKNEVSIPFSVSALETYEREVKAFLRGAYHNVNNTFVKHNKPFTEYRLDKKGNLVVKKEWPTYQHYLISDEDRTNEEIPLFTNVAPRIPNVIGDSIFEPGSRYTYVYSGDPIELDPFEEVVNNTLTEEDNLDNKSLRQREQARARRQNVADNLNSTQSFSTTTGRVTKNALDRTGEANKSAGGKGMTVSQRAKAMMAGYDVEGGGTGDVISQEIVSEEEIKKAVGKNPLGNANKKSSKFKSDDQNRVVVTYNYALAEVDKEKAYIEANSPFKVEEVKGLLKAGNGLFSFGSYINSLIKLSDKMEVGTGYHEFFHGIWDVFTDDTEKQRIRDEFRSREGSFVDRESRRTIQYKDATDWEIEEQIAEEFRDKKLYGIDPPQARKRGFLRNLFAKLMKWIRFAFNKQQVRDLKHLFARMDSAYYKNVAYKADPANIEKLRRTIGTLSVKESHTVVMHVVGQVIKDLATTDIRALNELDFSSLKALKASTIFDNVRDGLEDYFENTKAFYLQQDNPPSEQELSNKLDIVKSNILENWPQVLTYVREVLKTYRIIQESELDIEGLDSDYGGRNSDSYLVDAFTIDGKKNAPASIKLLLATLQESDWEVSKKLRKLAKKGEEDDDLMRTVYRRDLNTGLTMLVNYAQIYNKLVEELVSSNTMKQKVQKIRKLAKKNPNLARLYTRLKLRFTKELNIDEWALRIKFANTFSKMAPEPLAMYYNEDGSVDIERADVFTALKAAKSNWLGELKNSDLVEYARPDDKKDGRPSYWLPVNNLIGIKTGDSKGVFRFLDTLGLGFGENESRVELNEADGNMAKLTAAVAAIKDTFAKSTTMVKKQRAVRASSVAALDINGPLTAIFEVKFDVEDLSPEGSYLNFEGNRVQKYVQTNAVSRMINDINNAKSYQEVVADLPHLTGLYSQDSVYMNNEIFDTATTGKKRPKGNLLALKYVVGVFDRLSGEGIPTTKLSKGMRAMLAINQNLRGNYYVLLPADSKTEYMVSMKNIYKKLDKATIDQFYEYYSTEQSLPGKSRKRLFNFMKDKLSRDAFEKEFARFINTEVETQFKQLLDYRLIKAAKEGKYNFAALDSKWAKSEGYYEKDNLSEQQIKEILTLRTLNFVANNTEIHKIFFGDPARYKDPTKRYKSFLSPREQSFYDSEEFDDLANSVWNTVAGVKLKIGDPGYLKYSTEMKTSTWSDVNVAIEDIPNYMNINSTDGQGIAPLAGYKQMRIKNAYRWSQADEDQFQYEMSMDRLLMEEDGYYTYTDDKLKEHDEAIVEKGDPRSAVFSPLKPVASGFYSDEEGDDNPFLDKFSIYGYTYRSVREHSPHMAQAYVRMVRNGISYIVYESGRKVGTKETESLYENGEPVPVDKPYNPKSIVNVPFKWFGIQVETSGVKYNQTIGSQLSKLATINLLDNGVPVDYMADVEPGTPEYSKRFEAWSIMTEAKKAKISPIYRLVLRDAELRAALVERGYYDLLDKVGIKTGPNGEKLVNKNKLLSAILDELTRRDLNDSLREALKINPETEDFEIPLEALNNYEQIKSIIFSYVDKYIASPKVNGGPKIQVSGAGFMVGDKRVKPKTITTEEGEKKTIYVSSGLKFYENKDGKRYMEVLLPNWFAKKLAKAGIDPYKLDLKNLDDDILTGIGFRIPTQELNSVEIFKVAGFLPESMGDTVVVPEAITTKTGSDFDVDKLNTYLKNVYIDTDGSIKAVPAMKNYAEAVAFFGARFDARLERQKKAVEKGLDFTDRVLNAIQSQTLELAKTTRLENFIKKNSELINSLLQGATTDEEFREIEQDLIDAIKSLDDNKKKLNNENLQAETKRREINKMFKQSLENEYFRNLENILSREENFNRLTTPNTSKDLMSMRDRLVKISEEEFGEGAVKSVISPSFMNTLRHNYIMGRGGVGIAANNQVNTALMQKGPVVIDPEKIDKLQDINEWTFIKDGKVNLPANRITINGTSYVTLSGTVDAAGQYISDKISQYINGFVDIAKDAFLVQLGVSYANAGTYMVLEKLGVPTDVVMMFMNQPIIREFNKKLEAEGKTYTFNTNVLKDTFEMFQTEEEAVTSFEGSEKDTKEFTADLLKQFEGVIKAYYGKDKRQLTPKEKALQNFVLREYLKYTVMARNLFRITRSSNFDTANLSNPYIVERKYEAALELENDNIFSNVRTVLDNTYMNNIMNRMMDASEDVSDGYFKFLNINTSRYFKPVIRDFAKRRKFLSDADFANVARKVEQSFISYLIQNSHDPNIGAQFNKDIQPLLLDALDSVAVRVGKLKKVLALSSIKRNSTIATNPIIKMLVTEDREGNLDTKIVKMFNKSSDIFSQNTNIAAMEELRDAMLYVPSGAQEPLRDLYQDLVKVAFLQSGIAFSNISFTDIIPVEDYKNVILPALDIIEQTGVNHDILQGFMKSDTFYRNNWSDTNIVPSEKEEYNQQGNPKKTYMTPSLRNFLDELSKKGKTEEDKEAIRRMPVHRVYATSRNFGAKYISMAVKAENFKTVLFRRVEYSDGTPFLDSFTNQDGDQVFFSVYVGVNAWGDRIRAQEHYTYPRRSILNNNTVKMPIELSNQDILSAIGDVDKKESKGYRSRDAKEKQLAGTPEFNKLPKKSSKRTMTYAGVGSRQTPADILDKMTALAKRLESLGYTLNTGAPEDENTKIGADEAFRKGAKKRNLFGTSIANKQTRAIAKEIHPAPGALKGKALDYMARNTNQVFGANLKTPVDFVLAWTPDGMTTTKERTIKSGGTAQAIDMAYRKGIPVINLANKGWEQELEKLLKKEAKNGKSKGESKGILLKDNKFYQPEDITEELLTKLGYSKAEIGRKMKLYKC